jgi:hypothetical protein
MPTGAPWRLRVAKVRAAARAGRAATADAAATAERAETAYGEANGAHVRMTAGPPEPLAAKGASDRHMPPA